MEVRLASVAAPGRVNEDYALAAGNLVAILDGVTQPEGVDTGCVHSPAWYVHRLVGHLYTGHTSRPDAGLAQLLADAIDAVRDDHGGQCDLDQPATPAATVCALKVGDDQAEYLVLGDSPMVLQLGADVTVVADDRFRTVVAEIQERTLVPGGVGTAGQADRVRRYTPQKYQYTNQPGGYWIAAADPRAAYEAVSGAVPLHGLSPLRRAALLTDGASCAVEEYGLYDWAGLLDLVTGAGPAELLRQVRAVERSDPAGTTHMRYKRHDDATLAVCLFIEEG